MGDSVGFTDELRRNGPTFHSGRDKWESALYAKLANKGGKDLPSLSIYFHQTTEVMR